MLHHREVFTFHTLLNRSALGHLRFSGGVQGRVCVSRRRRFVRPAAKLKMSVRHVSLTWNMVSLCTLGFLWHEIKMRLLGDAWKITWHLFLVWQDCPSRSETRGFQLKRTFQGQMWTRSTTHRTWNERYFFLSEKPVEVFFAHLVQLLYNI